MAWIELHDTLPDHPKTVAAAHALKMDKDMLAGKLMRLWTWALRNRLSGYLSKEDLYTVAEIMRWDGKPAVLLRALCTPPRGYDHGFIERAEDGGYLIHDWDVYTSQFRAQDTLRRKDRERKKAAKCAPEPAHKKREKLSAGIPAEQTRNSSPYQYPTLREEEEEDTYALAHAGERRGDDGADRRDVQSDDGEDRRDDRAAAPQGSPVDACIGTPSAPGEQAQPARSPYPQTAAAPGTPSPAAWQQVSSCHEAEIGPIGAGTYLRTLQAYTAQIGADAVCLAIESTNLAQPKQPSALLLRILEDWQAAGVHDVVSARKHLSSRSIEQTERKRAAAHARQASHTGRRKPPPIDQLPEDYNPYYQAFWG